MSARANVALFVAAEIVLVVTPMMWPQIPVHVGLLFYIVAFGIVRA
jgi:hypothetical protein